MGKGEEYAGYFCLMIAIFCKVSADEAWLLYWHGPDHPICQRILGKKIPVESGKKFQNTAEWMLHLHRKGYSLEEIAEIFDCFPSTVKRRIEKIAGSAKEE